MARTPSRPGYLIAGGLVFLLLPIAFSLWDNRPIERNWVLGGIAACLYFFGMAYQSHRLMRKSNAPELTPDI